MSKCGNCKKDKSSCGCPTGSGGVTTSQLSQQIAQLNDEVNTIATAIQAFINGHPILMIQNADDIACFNLSTGIGSTTWQGWGLCNGLTYLNAITNKNLAAPNLLDKFIVGAGGTYAVGDTGGLDSVSLTSFQNGVHTHTINDAGHSHNITDPGHHHSITDPGHNHGGSSAPHTHSLTINNNSPFTMQVPDPFNSFSTGAGSNAGYIWDGTSYSASPAGGVHTHTGSADPSSTAVVISNNYTGITQTTDAFIGITQTDVATTGVTINNAGSGAPHENRPPYYSLIFCIKI